MQPFILPNFRVDGRWAMVTGAGAGIGSGIAVGLAEAGADVVLIGRTRKPLEETAEQVRAYGREAVVMACDVTDRAAVRAAIAGLSRLDVLINNAGISIPEPFLEVSDASLDATVGLNVTATYVVSQAAVRKMVEDAERRAKDGAIVNISSQMGHIGAANRTAYCAAKARLNAGRASARAM